LAYAARIFLFAEATAEEGNSTFLPLNPPGLKAAPLFLVAQLLFCQNYQQVEVSSLIDRLPVHKHNLLMMLYILY
jgi:hypothetical protein